MGVSRFTDLLMWQDARALAKAIFPLTQKPPFAADGDLVRQINRSANSVMANIAEGFGRGTQGEFVTFLGYAIGSLNETQSHLTTAHDRKYLDSDAFARLFTDGTEVRKKIVAFVRSMVLAGSGVKNIRNEKNWSENVWEMYERITGRPRPEHIRQLLENPHRPPTLPNNDHRLPAGPDDR